MQRLSSFAFQILSIDHGRPWAMDMSFIGTCMDSSIWLPPLATFHHETHLWAARPWRCLELEMLEGWKRHDEEQSI